MRLRLAILLAFCAALASCSEPANKPPYPPVSGDELKAHLVKFAEIAKTGDSAGSQGEEQADAYIADFFQSLGLKTTMQEIPLVELTITAGSMQVTGQKGSRTLRNGDDFVGWTRQQKDAISVNTDMVFVGYGIVAPEFKWDDYKDADVTGKIVVALMGDPHVGQRDVLGTVGATYYSRPQYKFEEAARHGAAGALIIHNPDETEIDWDDIRSGAQEPILDIDRGDQGASYLPLEGWISSPAAGGLAQMAGLDVASLIDLAQETNFEPVLVPVKGALDIKTARRNLKSKNVVAMLDRTSSPTDSNTTNYVLFGGHWNVVPPGKPTGSQKSPPQISDEAGGAGLIMELARALKNEPKRDASFVFLITTAEEEGLLGSEYYAQIEPLYPLETTRAAIMLDGLTLIPDNHELRIIGFAYEAITDILKDAAAEQTRVVAAEKASEKTYYYRYDQFNYTQRGVPSLYLTAVNRATSRSSERVTDGGTGASQEMWPHLALDTRLLFELGTRIASSSNWPKWRPVESSEVPKMPKLRR